ncbi:MAG TPA: FtsQ-type POTRA domain-containing protein [Thermoanaerobaculia bacterium]|jgi:cell division protein FtsQ|nr:FtsQ-type POTRA domain-containing protein [Thermoanaerobaculia bacterium]
MAAGYDSTSPRFFRPTDVARLRRNQRRIQLQRFFSIAGKVVVIGGILVGLLLAYQHTQGDARFAVKAIEIAGATHTPRAAIDAVTNQYIGANLFRIDIAKLQADLRRLGWVKRIEAEKKLPDTLRIRIVEREAVALVAAGDRMAYVDEDGVAFAELSPSVGDADLPVITNAAGADLARCVALVRGLRMRDPQVYSRISEVKPVAPNGFALFDRALGAFVYADEGDLSAKWRDLYAVARAEHLGVHDIEYADLRFAGRIIVKPIRAATLAPVAPQQPIATQITN